MNPIDFFTAILFGGGGRFFTNIFVNASKNEMNLMVGNKNICDNKSVDNCDKSVDIYDNKLGVNMTVAKPTSIWKPYENVLKGKIVDVNPKQTPCCIITSNDGNFIVTSDSKLINVNRAYVHWKYEKTGYFQLRKIYRPYVVDNDNIYIQYDLNNYSFSEFLDCDNFVYGVNLEIKKLRLLK